MTAEVAIANSGAVALAADSAVTIGGQKIYNSALKLFSLSKVAPVGIMIYGNAGLLNVPWEVLIKSYRKDAGNNYHNELASYADDFIEFLNQHQDAFPKSRQIDWITANVAGYYRLIRDEFFNLLHPVLQNEGEVDSETVYTTLSRVVASHHSRLMEKSYCEGMSKRDFNVIRKKHARRFKSIRDEVFEEIKISAALSAKLNDIAVFLHVKDIYSEELSGLVISGYGEQELYPSIITFEVEGVVENKLKYRKNTKKSLLIKDGTECGIIAFAQEDMVATFMSGINPSVAGLLQGYLNQLFSRLPELLNEKYVAAAHRRDFKQKAEKQLEEFFKEFYSHVQNDHVQPVLRMVNVLPKDELAAMAEALVNLTAFKRRIAESMETVGGPIDVAVISKGDGLVWVKRKHYFPAELNQHFFKNYFRELTYE